MQDPTNRPGIVQKAGRRFVFLLLHRFPTELYAGIRYEFHVLCPKGSASRNGARIASLLADAASGCCPFAGPEFWRTAVTRRGTYGADAQSGTCNEQIRRAGGALHGGTQSGGFQKGSGIWSAWSSEVSSTANAGWLRRCQTQSCAGAFGRCGKPQGTVNAAGLISRNANMAEATCFSIVRGLTPSAAASSS
jgi:hypothetical protein